MKKLLISFICLYGFVLSNAVTSQELNEAFLKSLPKSIQEDFLNADADETLSDNFNQRPETRIRKAESAIDDIKIQIEYLESQIERENTKEDVIIFGSNFFDSYQRTQETCQLHPTVIQHSWLGGRGDGKYTSC